MLRMKIYTEESKRNKFMRVRVDKMDYAELSEADICWEKQGCSLGLERLGLDRL